MSVTFTKLFSSITESTVWCEPAHTRLVWITMLAMADKRGRVWASVPGLANRARVPTEDCRKAINTFMAPDRDSRTPDHDGRRIEPIDGGWRLLNYGKYRDIRDEEDRQEYKREWDRNNRGRTSDKIRQNPTESDPNRHNAEAEAEAEAERSKTKGAVAPSFTDLGIDEQVAKDWLAVRKAKRAGPVTNTVIQALQREAKAAGITPNEAVKICAERGWQGFKAEWMGRETGKDSAPSQTMKGAQALRKMREDLR